MKKSGWVYGFWIVLSEAVGTISAWISSPGMDAYMETIVRPPLAPPGWVFAVVWPILYALMGIGAARIWLAEPSKERSMALNLFVAQLVVNFFWSPIFFNAGAYGFALLWLLILWVLVARMIVSFYKVDPLAGLLQIPYLLWLTFAAYLNWGIWRLNRIWTSFLHRSIL